MNDALNHPIELEKTYGYSTTTGGWAMVVTGVAKKFTKTKVTLEVKSRRNFLYGEPNSYARNTSKTVSVLPYHLFPVVT